MCSDKPWIPNDPSFAEQELAASSQQVAAVWRDADTSVDDCDDVGCNNDGEMPDVCTDSSKRFDVLPVSAEFLDEGELVKRLIASVNIAGDDFYGDGVDGYRDSELFDIGEDDCNVFTMTRNEKGLVITKEVLARRWGVGLDVAHRTLRVTTQRGVRTFLRPSERRLTTHLPHLSYSMIRGSKMYSDTMFAKTKSIRKFTCAQNWTDGQGYTLFYPMKSKSEAPTTVSRMCHDMKALPVVIVTDGAGEERGTAFRAEGKYNSFAAALD